MIKHKLSSKFHLVSFIILLLGLIVISFNFISKKRPSFYQNGLITSIEYTENCVVVISTSSGYKRTIDITDVYSRECVGTSSPLISPNGKFAAFSLVSTTNTLSVSPNGRYEPHEYQSNSVYLYQLPNNEWSVILEHGAAEVANLSFLSDNDLQVQLIYDGTVQDSVKLDVQEHINSENECFHEASMSVSPED